MDISSYTKRPIHRLRINGIDYAYLEEGKGELVILLHGFPDNAITYEKVMEAYAKAGYWVIAPFLRGYYPTGISSEGDYSVASVASDIFEISNQLGVTSFYLVGHDWGASIAYFMANQAPERIKKLITLAIPHPRLIRPSLKLLLRANHFVIFRFRKFGLWYTRRNNFAYLDRIYRKWAPDWKIPEKHRKMMKEAYALPGRLEAAIGYYWSFYDSLEDKANRKIQTSKTSVPTLSFAGHSDGAIDINQFANMDQAFTSHFELVLMERVGHFPHQEDPKGFIEKSLAFLQVEAVCGNV